MKKVTLENYRADKYYPRIVRAVAALLAKSATIAPVDVFVEMNLLQASDLESWRFGRIPYLEKVIRCNLAAASRILRILRMHVHELKLQPSLTEYRKWGKGPKFALRFTKTGDPGVEEAYCRHFLAPGASSKRGREKLERPRTPENGGYCG
jgi:hypothetical protein